MSICGENVMLRKAKSTPPSSKVLSDVEMANGVQSIQRRIDELKEFDVSTIQEETDPKASALVTKVNATLANIFGEGTPELARHSIGYLDRSPTSADGNYTAQEIQEGYREGIKAATAKLEASRDLLQEWLKDGQGMGQETSGDAKQRAVGNEVFIVHGHDESAREAVARFIQSLGLKPIILHEQPNAGRTIIEKLEAHTAVDFAVVLLTPDDMGSLASDETSTKPRARQNVVFELGLFVGALGRERVCALHKGNIELPSDFNGVLYVPMDDNGGWKRSLVREMRQAGLEIDLNKAL